MNLEHIVVSKIWITNLKTERFAFEVTAVKLFNLKSSVGRIKKSKMKHNFTGITHDSKKILLAVKECEI